MATDCNYDMNPINYIMELKSCPFCREPARLFVAGGGVCVKCTGGFEKGCGAQTDWYSDDNYVDGMQGWRKTRKTAVERAVEAWNRRVTDVCID